MRSWDDTHSIAADDLRDLLRGRRIADPDPRGLRLRGARILGRLDLDNLTTAVKLTLLDCLLDEGITAEAAHLPGLSLQRCLLTHEPRSALHADELRTDAGVSFEGSTIRACTADGAIRLNGAHIGGRLNFSGTAITNAAGAALHGGRLKVNDNVLLSAGFTAHGAGERGAVRLTAARIGVQLECSGAVLTNSCGPALRGERFRVGGDVFLRAGFTADGNSELSTVWLTGAHIGGQLDCSGAVVESRLGTQHRWFLDGLTYQ